jgi:hypothetical protein
MSYTVVILAASACHKAVPVEESLVHHRAARHVERQRGLCLLSSAKLFIPGAFIHEPELEPHRHRINFLEIARL